MKGDDNNKYMKIFLCLFLFLLPLTAQAAPDPLAEMQVAFIREDFTTARRLAGELVAKKLSRAQLQEAHYFLGLSDLRLGNFAQAQETFNKLISERLPIDLYDRTAVGFIDALYLQGSYDRALKESMSLLKKRKNSEILGLFYLKAARANLKLARWKRARELLQTIIDDFPHSLEAETAAQLLEEKQFFTVQVGSFIERHLADKLLRELQDRNEYAYIVEIKSGEGKMYYRVRVGQMAAIRDARELEQKLSSMGYSTLIYP